MITKTRNTLIFIAIIALFSFTSDESTPIEFSYPKKENAKITMLSHSFGEFSKEWQGTDLYFMATSKDSITCSVLYYKLNETEQKEMVEPFGKEANSAIPFIFFSQNSNLSKYEKNNSSWGEMTDDFIFRQNDIPEINGMKIKQKHMYAYSLIDKEMFVNIHLSKVNSAPSDSIKMRTILSSIKKIK